MPIAIRPYLQDLAPCGRGNGGFSFCREGTPASAPWKANQTMSLLLEKLLMLNLYLKGFTTFN